MRQLHASLLALPLALAAMMPASSLPASAQNVAGRYAALSTGDAPARPSASASASPSPSPLSCRILNKRNGSQEALILRLTAKDPVEGNAHLAAWALSEGKMINVVMWRELNMKRDDVVEFTVFSTNELSDLSQIGRAHV